MEILVQRQIETSEYTQGRLFIDGILECFTLEDQSQVKKVMHETRIPAGRYKVVIRQFGGHHDKYKVKFPQFHKGMLQIANVPGFHDILFHIGNTDDDSSGCILVGKSFVSGKLVNSTTAYTDFYKKVVKAAIDGNLWVTIKDK